VYFSCKVVLENNDQLKNCPQILYYFRVSFCNFLIPHFYCKLLLQHTFKKFALKAIKKGSEDVGMNSLAYIENEVKILKSISHVRNIVSFQYNFC